MSYDDVEIEDMEWNQELQAFTYPCPCGDLFQITKEDLRLGEEIARCPSCSLYLTSESDVLMVDEFDLIRVRLGPDSLTTECYLLAVAIAARCPSLKHALHLLKEFIRSRPLSSREVFDGLVGARDRLSISSTIVLDLLIRAYCELRRGYGVMECFGLMKRIRVWPSVETWNCMFSVLIRLNEIGAVWGLFGEMISKEGDLKKADEVVGYMEGLGISPNIVTYNTLIYGHALKGDIDGADMALLRMKAKGIEPDSYTCGSLINWMYKYGDIGKAAAFLRKMEVSWCVPNAVVYNLISGFCGCGDVEKALSYRYQMEKRGRVPTVSTYNISIQVLMEKSRDTEAEMQAKNICPNEITYSILISSCCRAGDVGKALRLHDEMALAKGVLPDLGMFNTLIVGHCENANTEHAVSLLKEMERMKIAPDKVTYDTMMQSYCRVGKVEDAYSLLDVMSRRPDCISYNILICGYSKRGDMKDVMRIRDEMLSLGLDLNWLTFNAILEGLCEHGEGAGNHAEVFLKEMVYKGINPDDSTYISLIKGCTRASEGNTFLIKDTARI
ncbi:hypothetical protein SASPL_122406 [Salvia splendens]|uniref:DPH-type MB domain-containing protein n=1 Tax=Salvia splendens TaxID=180675 RepID=A0A8X8ZR62_SALSN|nr:hypothetical protein SASPL_122406 [Salvia splendens]